LLNLIIIEFLFPLEKVQKEGNSCRKKLFLQYEKVTLEKQVITEDKSYRTAICDDICKCCLTERRGRGGKGQCEYLIIYDGPEPTDESIEGFGGLSRFLHILPCL